MDTPLVACGTDRPARTQATKSSMSPAMTRGSTTGEAWGRTLLHKSRSLPSFLGGSSRPARPCMAFDDMANAELANAGPARGVFGPNLCSTRLAMSLFVLGIQHIIAMIISVIAL